jgi:hypothetical protein
VSVLSTEVLPTACLYWKEPIGTGRVLAGTRLGEKDTIG